MCRDSEVKGHERQAQRTIPERVRRDNTGCSELLNVFFVNFSAKSGTALLNKKGKGEGVKAKGKAHGAAVVALSLSPLPLTLSP